MPGSRILVPCLAALLAGEVSATELEPPADVLDGLRSDSYPRRVESEEQLAAWAERSGEASYAWLLRASKANEDPEVRDRAFSVLRRQVMLLLDEKRPGYVGITMLGAEMDFEGEVVPVIRITSVQPGSPADEAGLVEGDAILKMDGESWEKESPPDQLGVRVSKMTPGTKIELHILRDGEARDVGLTLAARPWSAGEWGQQRRIRIDPFARGVFPRDLEAHEREKAFQRWLEERQSADEAE